MKDEEEETEWKLRDNGRLTDLNCFKYMSIYSLRCPIGGFKVGVLRLLNEVRCEIVAKM